ncbi:hypothetical protein NP493_300g03003 [Ridgeia piscesae]|uniref:Globin domain-containing protein n=1 Tax=Ridgeia piscesae TaxID=27915 RepID=A0AAD9NW76_RIDPI|nr:hypothetical protein NP493_300g03003 [Ridgeia piscesae]
MAYRQASNAGDVKEDSGDDEEEEVEPWKLFHLDVWLRKGLDVKKPPEPVKISEDQKRLVRETWPRVNAHQRQAGTHMYLRIFQVCPAIKGVFRLQDVANENVTSHPKMMMHAVRFIQSIEVAVDHMDALDEIVAPVFVNLGRRHLHYKNLLEDQFSMFSHGVLYSWHSALEHVFKAEVQSAWNQLFEFIVQHMEFGFMTALADKEAEQEALHRKYYG